MSGLFEALGDPIRRLIVESLGDGDGERPAGAIVDSVRSLAPISQPAISQHLGVLRDAGLVSVRVEGTRRYYALDRTGVDAARAWLDQVVDPLASFTQPLDALATEVARGRRTRRRDVAERMESGEHDERTA